MTAQSPGAGTVVVEGTQVRINVSKGPKPVTVPNVVGLPYDQAASELQRAGFGVARIDVDSDQAAGIVTDQEPNGGSEGSKGSTVTRLRLEGPVDVGRSRRHDAGRLDRADDARGCGVPHARRARGHRRSDASTASSSRRIPVGGTQAKPNALVTLFVGRFVETTTTTP